MIEPLIPTTDRPYQLLPPLSDEQRHVLRQSIEKNGVLEPVVFDEDGEILDGHHRVEIAEDLGIDYPRRVIDDLDRPGKHMYALTVNVARRQLDSTARSSLVAQMRLRGMSIRQIAEATGVSYGTVRNDLAQVSKTAHLPERVTGADGKEYASSRPAPAPAPEPEPEPDLQPDVLRVLADAGPEGRTAWQVAFLLDSANPDVDRVAKALHELSDAGHAVQVGRSVGLGHPVWALADPGDQPEPETPDPAAESSTAPVVGSGSTSPEAERPADPEEGPADVPTQTTDPATIQAAVNAALDQHVPDPDAPKRAWRKDLHERLKPIGNLTLWLRVDAAAQFADEDDVETLRQLALSFTDLHRRVVEARTANVTPLRRLK